MSKFRPFSDMPGVEITYSNGRDKFAYHSAVWQGVDYYICQVMGIKSPMMETPIRRAESGARVGRLVEHIMKTWPNGLPRQGIKIAELEAELERANPLEFQELEDPGFKDFTS